MMVNGLVKFASALRLTLEASPRSGEFAKAARELIFPLVWLPSVCVLVVLTPYFIMLDESAFNGARIVELVFIVLSGCVGIFSGINSSCKRKRILFTLIILAFLSLVNSKFLSAALQEIGRFFAILLLVFLYSDRLTKRQQEWAVMLLLIPAAGYCVHFLFDFTLNVVDVGRRYVDMVGFKNRRFFNGIQVVVLPLILSLLTVPYILRVKSLKFGIFIVCIVWCFMALYSGGRGAALSVSLAFLMIFMWSRENKAWRQRVTPIAWVVCLAVILYFIYYYFSPEAAPEYILRGGSSGRLKLWSDVVFSGEISLLGNGPQSYIDFSWRQYGANKTPFSTPHNSLISALYEYGVIGATALAGLMLFLLNFLAGKIRSNPSSIEVGAAWAMLSFAIYSAFDGIQYSSITGIIIPLVGGLVISISRRQQESSFHPNKVFSLSVCVPVLFSALYVLVTVCWLALYSCMIGPKTCDGNYIHTTMPRFFERGEYFMIDDIPDSYRERFLR